MHNLQYIATIVDTDGMELTEQEIKEQAFSAVKRTLEDTMTEYGSVYWYDWFIVGGGRWHSKSDENDVWHTPEDETDVIVCSEANMPRVLELLDNIDKKQIDEFNTLFGEFDFPTINSLFVKFGKGEPVSYEERWLANVYSLKFALDMFTGKWNWNSGFLDLDGWNTDTQHIRQMLGIDKSQFSGVYCLVPVDFHS